MMAGETLLRLLKPDAESRSSASDVARVTSLIAEVRAEVEAEYRQRIEDAEAAQKAAEREAAAAKERLQQAETAWSAERRQLEQKASTADAARVQAEAQATAARTGQQEAEARVTRLQGELDAEVERRKAAENETREARITAADRSTGSTPAPSYEFDIERNRAGLMTKIVATPI